MKHAALILALLAAAAPARAADTALSHHLRTEAADLRTLLRTTAAASPALQALIERLEGSDLIIYIGTRALPPSLDARIGWIGAAGGVRFLKIEIACVRPQAVQAAALAHELRHAAEIADAPWIDGPAALADHYSRIGIRSGSLDRVMFETDAARLFGDKVRHEVAGAARVTADRAAER
jgi:hypothetical protein